MFESIKNNPLAMAGVGVVVGTGIGVLGMKMLAKRRVTKLIKDIKPRESGEGVSKVNVYEDLKAKVDGVETVVDVTEAKEEVASGPVEVDEEPAPLLTMEDLVFGEMTPDTNYLLHAIFRFQMLAGEGYYKGLTPRQSKQMQEMAENRIDEVKRFEWLSNEEFESRLASMRAQYERYLEQNKEAA